MINQLWTTGSVLSITKHATGTHGVEVGDLADLVVVLGLGQHGEPVGVEVAALGVQLLAVLLAQLRAERVDRDDERSPVSLKLNANRRKEMFYFMTHSTHFIYGYIVSANGSSAKKQTTNSELLLGGQSILVSFFYYFKICRNRYVFNKIYTNN